jgi:hypothetical protein
MIQLRTDTGGPDASPLVEQLTETLTELCADEVRFDPEHFGEVSRAVESFLESCGGSSVDSRFLVLLASQALSAGGEQVAARRLLILGAGLVVPSEWQVSRDKDVWVLDLRQMTVPAGAEMELTLFTCLAGVLDAVADIWDATRGRGVLGLRHVCATAWAFADEPCRKRKALDLVEEIRAMCIRRFERMADARGWGEVPDVLNMDIWSGTGEA